jgi:AhpD family alkylhydroperoxidase
MATDWLALEKEYVARSRVLHRDGGAPCAAFRELVKATGTDGALSHRHKELIALGIAIATRCEGCIVFHTRALVRLGATREEILETIGVAIEMGGGPASVYGAAALDCYDRMVAAKEGS